MEIKQRSSNERKIRSLRPEEMLWSAIRGRMDVVSDAFYNRGHGLAVSGRIGEACETLSMALQFDKYNVNARNLLGLCYYRVGRIGDAVFQWQISHMCAEFDNPANEYIDHILFNDKQTDKMNYSVELYNAALDYLNGGNFDLALLRLKKCIELSPNFVEALCLLSLAYICTENVDKAEPHLRRVLQLDPSNEKALKYHAVVSGGIEPPARQRGTGKDLLDVRGYAKPSNQRNLVNDFRLPEAICLLIGAFVMTMAFIFLVMPGREEDFRHQISELNATIAITREVGDLALEQLAEEYAQIDERFAAIQDEFSAELDDLAHRIQNLQHAREYLDAGDFAEAFAIVHGSSTEGFTPEQAQQHAQILADSSSSLEAIYFQRGRAAHDARNFADANWFLTNARRFYHPQSPTAAHMYYLLGRVAQELRDIPLAILYFEVVTTRYPDSAQYHSAETRLRQLR